MALGTDNPILSPKNVAGLDSPSSGGLAFVQFPIILETECDKYCTIEPLIYTMPSLLKVKDPVTKLPSKYFRQFFIKFNTLPTPQEKKAERLSQHILKNIKFL